MFYQVYILYSKTFDKVHVGYSKEVHRKPTQHNAGKTVFTSGAPPKGSAWFCLITIDTIGRFPGTKTQETKWRMQSQIHDKEPGRIGNA